MEIRVDLASDGKVNLVHWFNDGWLYSTDIDGTEGSVPLLNFPEVGYVLPREIRYPVAVHMACHSGKSIEIRH